MALSPADIALDPSLVTSFGPPSALAVTPVAFQSVEQEGRWKPKSLMDVTSAGRVFELSGHGDTTTPSTPNLSNPYGGITRTRQTLFTLTCSHPGITISTEEGLKLSKSSSATIDVTWWSDGLEIYAGFAGLYAATGFGSVLDDNANVVLQAIPFGNYFPAGVFVTWTGWFNPQGPNFCEFRGGIVVYADGSNSGGSGGATTAASLPTPSASSGFSPPCYMQKMERDGKNTSLQFDPRKGFTLAY